jgi:hypothetical protein
MISSVTNFINNEISDFKAIFKGDALAGAALVRQVGLCMSGASVACAYLNLRQVKVNPAGTAVKLVMNVSALLLSLNVYNFKLRKEPTWGTYYPNEARFYVPSTFVTSITSCFENIPSDIKGIFNKKYTNLLELAAKGTVIFAGFLTVQSFTKCVAYPIQASRRDILILVTKLAVTILSADFLQEHERGRHNVSLRTIVESKAGPIRDLSYEKKDHLRRIHRFHNSIFF